MKAPSRSRTVWLAGLAALLWSFAAWRRSLWGDEFHSMHHALTESLGAFFASVRDDNHPPGAFWLERVSVQSFGLSAFALRLPSLVIGIAFLFLVPRFTAHFEDGDRPTTGRIAAWLVVLSSYTLLLFTEARMYALLALATLGLLVVLLDTLLGRPPGGGDSEARSPWALALWVALGLHSHYYFVHQLALTAVLIAGALVSSRAMRAAFGKRARRLVLPAIVGVAAWMPWAVYGFRAQLVHDLPPGQAAGGASTLVESIAHLFFFNTSVGGAWLTRAVVLPGMAVVGIALVIGLVRFVAYARRDARRRLFALLTIGFAFGLPLWGFAASVLVERSTYGWRYIAGAAAPAFLVAALGVSSPARFALVLRTLLCASMAIATLVVASAGGQEDHERMVRFIVANAAPNDAVMDKPPWDPDPKRAETSWQFYLPRVTNGASNDGLPQQLLYAELDRAREFDRVWVWFRDSYYGWVHRSLAETFASEEVWSMGPQMTLHLFSEKVGAPTGE